PGFSILPRLPPLPTLFPYTTLFRSFQYNTSQYYDNISSDPFYLALTPPEQFAREIFFCTPSADFPQNFLNVVCRKDDLDSLKITDRKSTRLNSSHVKISYAVFCLKK